MLVTPSGIVMQLRPMQLMKAPSPMLITVYPLACLGIVIFPFVLWAIELLLLLPVPTEHVLSSSLITLKVISTPSTVLAVKTSPSAVHGLRLFAVLRAGTGPAPTSDGAKLRKVCESAKKSGGKFGGNGKNAYLYSVKPLFGYPGRIPRGQDFTDTALGASEGQRNCYLCTL